MKRNALVAVIALVATIALPGSSAALAAKGIKQIVAKDGRFAFTDGSSIFRLRKGGAFELTPKGMSGRTIKGIWRSKNFRKFTIYGRWSWLNGLSRRNDYRKLTLHLSFMPGQKARRAGLRREKVWPVYFVVDGLVAISKAEYLRKRRSK